MNIEDTVKQFGHYIKIPSQPSAVLGALVLTIWTQLPQLDPWKSDKLYSERGGVRS